MILRMERIASLDDIPPEGLRIMYREGPFDEEAILVKLSQGDVRAYKNECRHLPMRLDEREPSDAEKIADVDWQSYLDAYPQTGMREARGNDERPSFESTLTRRATLSDHLLWQLQMDSIPEEEETAAQFIIGNLDDRGYLRDSVEGIARQAGTDVETVESALAHLHKHARQDGQGGVAGAAGCGAALPDLDFGFAVGGAAVSAGGLVVVCLIL